MICRPATLSARLRLIERDRALVSVEWPLTWPFIGGWVVAPVAVVVVTWVVDGAGAGDAGREGRLRMGRVRRAFILGIVCGYIWKNGIIRLRVRVEGEEDERQRGGYR